MYLIFLFVDLIHCYRSLLIIYCTYWIMSAAWVKLLLCAAYCNSLSLVDPFLRTNFWVFLTVFSFPPTVFQWRGTDLTFSIRFGFFIVTIRPFSRSYDYFRAIWRFSLTSEPKSEVSKIQWRLTSFFFLFFILLHRFQLMPAMTQRMTEDFLKCFTVKVGVFLPLRECNTLEDFTSLSPHFLGEFSLSQGSLKWKVISKWKYKSDP